MDKYLDNNQNNVIQLRLRSNLWRKPASLSTDSRRIHNIMASGALASVLFLVTVLNFALSQNETSHSGRGIASVAKVSDTGASKWDKSVLSRLAAKADRTMASIAHQPTDMDQLRFGLLEGKYAIKLDDGKVSEILYQETVGSGDRPKYLEKKDEFLTVYKGLIKPQFEASTRVNQVIDPTSGRIVETYQLLGPSSSPVAQVEFTSDQFGRFIGMKVHNQ